MASNIDKVNQFQELILRSFETYYNEMSKLNRYDITVEATITDVSKKPDGIYRVRTNGAEFDAYAMGGSYYKNDIVLVLIPNGDYTNLKFILGRKADADKNVTFAFKLPFDDFIGLRYLSEGLSIAGQYWANYPTHKINLYNVLNTPIWKWENPGDSTIGNTRLGIEADWLSRLGEYYPLRGTYGFRIVINGVSASNELDSSCRIEREEYFTNRDMYGNTYAFYTPYTLLKVIDVSDFLNIYSITIYWYQDFNFADSDNKHIIYDYNSDEKFDESEDSDIPVTLEESEEQEESNVPKEPGVPIIPENLGFENVNVYLGISAQDIKNETTFLYSYDSLSYGEKDILNEDTNTPNEDNLDKDTNEPEELSLDENNNESNEENLGEDTNISEGEEEVLNENTNNPKEDKEKNLIFAWVHYEKNGTFSVIKDESDLIKLREATGKTTHIYWYRFNYDRDITNDERTWKDEHKDLKDDWDLAASENTDYQTQIERYGGQGWTFLPYATDDFNIKIIPRNDKSREKIKVVVLHDGTHTTSKELILNNLRDVEAELAENSRNDKVVIKCFRLRKKDNDNKEAIEDNSINTFNIYDENNRILYNDDNERFDLYPYYLQVQCRNDDTRVYEILNTVSENDMPNGLNIYWAFPHEYTMIKSTEEVTKKDAKYFGIDPDSEPIRFKNFHNSTIKFKIKEIFNNRNRNNIVKVVIRLNDKEYHIERDLLFGRAEGLGHEFVPVIEILNPSGGTYLSIGLDFEIGCVVYKKDGTLYENPSLLNFEWKEISKKSSFCYYDNEEILHDGYYISSYSGEDEGIKDKYAGYKDNVIKGLLLPNKNDNIPSTELRITYPPIFEVTVSGAADYPLTVRKGFLICNNPDYKEERNFSLPSRVEFKSDGANPIYYSDYFLVAKVSIADDKTSNYELEYPLWKINNNDNSIFELKEETTEREFLLNNKTPSDDNKLSSNDNTSSDNDNTPIQSEDHNYTKYKILFKSTGNPQWTEDLLKNYTFIYYSVPNDDTSSNKNIYVAQSIAFDRNYYSSSLVNEWDGTSLTWDDENGAILSTMIAAGSKDGSNKFTGVMMGDWHTKGDESLDTPGLYGFNKGAQTFSFKTDGTGFIGSSGKGRIEFDGTEALISNADRSCYINLNPVNLSNKLTDINNQSFSENFIYCKVKKTDNKFTSVTDSINGESSWARSYFLDLDNDYFVVDPNYGVLTTGGVIARYGALGNWMISNEGLYQKTDGSYMYLGFDETDITDISELKKLLANLTVIQNDCENLYNALIKNEADLDKVISDLNAKESEKNSDTIKGYKELIIAAENEIVRLTNLNNNLLTEISNINNQIILKEKTIQDYDIKKGELIADISNDYDSIPSKETDRAVLELIIINNGNEYDIKLITIGKLILQVNDIINDLNYNKQLIDIYTEDLKNLNDPLVVTNSSYDLLLNYTNSLEKDFDKLYNNILIIKQQVVGFDKIIENYPNRVSLKTEIYDIIKDNLDELNDKYNCLYAEVNQENIFENTDTKIRQENTSEDTNTPDDQENITGNINATLLKLKEEISDKLTVDNNIITTAQTNISNLNTEIIKLQNDIKNKKFTILEFDLLIKILEADIIVLTNRRSGKELDITENSSGEKGINYLQNEIIRLNKFIDELEDAITNLRSNKDNLQNIINNEIKPEINNKKTIINNIQNDIANITDYKIITLNENSTFENVKNVIANLKNAIDNIIFTKQSTRYAIYVSTSEPNVSQTPVTPYFSVTLDGTMFARRGLIANTWSIDDTSLSYIKSSKKLTNGEIFDKIYIGLGEANNAIIDPIIEAKIYPNENTRPVANRWVISAGLITDYTDSAEAAGTGKDTDYINFGVTLSGELYSQLGTIGGWKINLNLLYAANGQMIFDSENSRILIGNPINVNNSQAYPIMIDGTTGLMSIAGTNNTNLTTGYLYLGNLSLEAISTDSEWKVPYAITQSNGDTRYNIKLENIDGKYNNNNSWGSGESGSINASVAPLTYYNLITTTNTKQLNSSNTFNIITRDSSGNYGVAIASGITSDGEKITAIYPTGCSNNSSSLGISGHRWNIYANILDVNSINTTGAISAVNMYMNQEKVATLPWTYGLLAKVWNALNRLSNAAGSNANSINGLGGALASKAIISATLGGGTRWNPFGASIGLTLATKENKAYLTTSHDIDLTHSHELNGEFSEGVFECTIGGPVFKKTNLYKYDVSTSDWYKKHAYNKTIISTGDKNAKIYSISGSVLETVDCSSIYSAGYWKGYSDGKDEAKCTKYHEGDHKGEYELMWVRVD